MGKYDLDNREYDNYLAANKKTKELKQRKEERKNLSRNVEGWHFGIGDKPVYTKTKEEFRRELDKRGLMMEDDIKGKRKIINPNEGRSFGGM